LGNDPAKVWLIKFFLWMVILGLEPVKLGRLVRWWS